MKLKKAICWLGILAFGLGGAACGGKNTAADPPTGAPDHSAETGTLDIDCWIAPKMTDAAYEEFADCGYNMLHLSNTSVHVEGANADYDKLNEALDTHFTLAEKYGIRVVLSMNARNSKATNATPFSWVDNKLKKTLTKWKDTDTFYGYMAYDEPRLTQGLPDADPAYGQRVYAECADYIRDEYVWFSANYPGKAFETVLLRAPNDGETMNYGPGLTEYPAYLDYYFEKVLKYMPYDQRIYSMDAYPFGRNRDSLTVRETFIDSLEETAYKARSARADLWTYTQNHCYVYNTASVLYQYYTAMAYGYAHFVTFCYNYVDWGYEQSSIDVNGRKTDNYYYYKEAHKEVRSFENVFTAFADDWVGALAYEGGERPAGAKAAWVNADRLLDGYGRIKNVSAAQDTLIGVMRDGGGYDGFMVTNQAAPFANTRNRVEITFDKAAKAIVYTDGEAAQTVTLDGGRLTLDLKSGGGAFVIPVWEG